MVAVSVDAFTCLQRIDLGIVFGYRAVRCGALYAVGPLSDTVFIYDIYSIMVITG